MKICWHAAKTPIIVPFRARPEIVLLVRPGQRENTIMIFENFKHKNPHKKKTFKITQGHC